MRSATAKILVGDNRQTLPTLPAKSVHCVVTSPPYFGLRDYQTAAWEGGDNSCGHQDAAVMPVSKTLICKRCGASKIDRQLGLEPSPDEYVAAMVGVFSEVHRVLRDDGTLWLNLGDSYANDGKWGGHTGGKHAKALHCSPIGRNKQYTGLKAKDLIGIPWMVAFALREFGFYLRQDIIWHKPSPMPESVTDRCTKAHEYVFLLTKSPTYYYDAEAIKEPANYPLGPGNITHKYQDADIYEGGTQKNLTKIGARETRNKRSVWTVASQPFAGAHFATFPPKLIEPMILAGTSEHGCCPTCGSPWDRVTSRTKKTRERPNEYVKRTGEAGTGNSCANTVAGVEVTTLRWEQSCKCPAAEPVPCAVLDPFGGAGTTAKVAISLGRNAVLCELNPEYAAMAQRRIDDVNDEFALFTAEASDAPD